jgi:hypothetical protein
VENINKLTSALKINAALNFEKIGTRTCREVDPPGQMLAKTDNISRLLVTFHELKHAIPQLSQNRNIPQSPRQIVANSIFCGYGCQPVSPREPLKSPPPLKYKYDDKNVKIKFFYIKKNKKKIKKMFFLNFKIHNYP